ncbi:MAG: hydantoinase/oxoprolinase family protein [Gaiellaceae bacterium]
MYLIGIDTGGTFTDCAIADDAGRIATGKALSTPGELEVGVLDALENAAAELGMSAESILAETAVFCHATTAGLNELYSRSGSRIALLTTLGHEDAVRIGRVYSKVAGLGDLEATDVARLRKPAPLVKSSLIFGVAERVDVAGEIVFPLTEDEVERVVDLVADSGVDAVAISLLWSFRNPGHEQRLAAAIRARLPGVFVTVSSELAPVLGEYERSITSAINSYIGPTLRVYLESLRASVRDRGLGSDPLVMQSNGGVTPLGEALGRPVNLLNSGPVGGVIAAAVLGEQLGHANIITTDVGGTSFDVSVIVDGQPTVSSEPLLDRFAVLTPMVDVRSIGAGGGSIAWVNAEDRGLRVGPMSAGSDPGPACFGRGGTLPTVTDANLVLNRLNPANFFGGRLRLDREAAELAIELHVAGPLGIEVVEAAAGIVDIVDNLMADLVRRMTTERGHDARDFVLYAFGGGGPLHVGAYGGTIGAQAAIIPTHAAVLSALGVAAADAKHYGRISAPTVMPFDVALVNQTFAELARNGHAALASSGFDLAHEHFVTMRFRNQTHDVAVPILRLPLAEDDIPALTARFFDLYDARYGAGTALRDTIVEAVTYEVVTTARIASPRLPELPPATEGPDEALRARRDVVFARETHETPIYDGTELRPGHRLVGPCVIETVATTVPVHPGQVVTVDRFGNLELALTPRDERDAERDVALSVEG